MALARVMQLLCQIQPPGILPVAAIDHVAKRAHALLRIVVEPDGADGFAIDQSDLLAPAQIGDRVVAPFGGDTVGNTAAIAAAVKAEHEARPLRRAAVNEGIDAKRAVRADEPRVAPLEEVETRPPHQRPIAEHPQVAAVLIAFSGHWRGEGNRWR